MLVAMTIYMIYREEFIHCFATTSAPRRITPIMTKYQQPSLPYALSILLQHCIAVLPEVRLSIGSHSVLVLLVVFGSAESCFLFVSFIALLF